jgi:hypothetical protein
MLAWLVDWIFAAINFIPVMWFDEGSAKYHLVRGMLALILGVGVLGAIAFWPARLAISRLWMGKGRSGSNSNNSGEV